MMDVIYHCPSDKRLLCEWSGYANKIEQHFLKQHRNLLYYKNTVDIDLNLSTDNKLIILNRNIYLLQINLYGKQLDFKLRYLGDNNVALKFTYDLIINFEKSFFIPVYNQQQQQWQINLAIFEKYHENLQSLICTISIHCNDNDDDDDVVDKINTRIDSTDDDDDDDDDDVELRYMEALRLVQNKIQQLNQRNSDIFDSVSQLNWSILEEPLKRQVSRENSWKESKPPSVNIEEEQDGVHVCYVCHKDMLPPIYLCINGHNICVNCRQSLCVCDGQITNIRNIEEENFSRTHQHPCRYHSNGCIERLYYNELRTHETKCYFCKYQCSITNCNYNDKYEKFLQHLKIHHSSIKIFTNHSQYDFPKDLEFFIVNLNKGIFYCRSETINDDQCIKWLAMFCGPKERRFFCELRFKNSRLIDPLFLKHRDNNIYELIKTKCELKKMKVKEKNAILIITSFD